MRVEVWFKLLAGREATSDDPPRSVDLGERVVAAVAAGQSCRAVARLFDPGPATVVRWVRRQRTFGACAPRPMGGVHHAVLLPERGFHGFSAQDVCLRRNGRLIGVADRTRFKMSASVAAFSDAARTRFRPRSGQLGAWCRIASDVTSGVGAVRRPAPLAAEGPQTAWRPGRRSCAPDAGTRISPVAGRRRAAGGGTSADPGQARDLLAGRQGAPV